jgi:hypothetical protein
VDDCGDRDVRALVSETLMRHVIYKGWTTTWTIVYGVVGLAIIAWDRLRDRRRTADY